ncbi:MAG: LLM class flavin-dependent oxidoreductase, partial [Nitrososphaeria archaeon]
AGELADGWISPYTTPELFKKDAKEVLRAAEKTGKKPKIGLLAASAIEDTKEEAIKTLRALKGLILWVDTVKRLGYEVPEKFSDLNYTKLNPLSVETRNRLREYVEWLPDNLLYDFTICGNKKEVEEFIERYHSLGADFLVILDFSKNKNKALNIFSDVIKNFK